MTAVHERLPDRRAGEQRHRIPSASERARENELWRPNTGEWAMRGRLGAVAAILIDRETASLGAKNGSPVRDRARGNREHLGRSRSRKTRFWPPK
jgi:hypothetical protein